MPRNLINQKCWHRRVSACAVGMCFRHVPCVQGRFASTPCFIVFPRGLSMRFKVLVDRISKPAALLEDKSHSTCDTTILQLAMPPRHGILLHMIYKELNFTGLNSWQECDLPRCLHSFCLLKLWRIWPRLSARKSLNSHSWQFSGVRLAFHQHEQSLQGQPRREFQTNDTKLDMHGGVAQQSQGGAIGHCSFSTENFPGVWRRLRKASRRAHTHTQMIYCDLSPLAIHSPCRQDINFDKFKPVMLAALRSLNLAIKFDVWHILAFSLVQPIDDAPGIYLRSCKELWFEWIDLFFPSQYFSSAWRCLFILERSTKVGYHESSLYKCGFYIYIYTHYFRGMFATVPQKLCEGMKERRMWTFEGMARWVKCKPTEQESVLMILMPPGPQGYHEVIDANLADRDWLGPDFIKHCCLTSATKENVEFVLFFQKYGCFMLFPGELGLINHHAYKHMRTQSHTYLLYIIILINIYIY